MLSIYRCLAQSPTDRYMIGFAALGACRLVMCVARWLIVYFLTKQALAKSSPSAASSVLEAAAKFNRSFRR